MKNSFVLQIGICFLLCFASAKAVRTFFWENPATDPCHNYRRVEEPNRSVDVTIQSRDDIIDDSNMVEDWYRFVYQSDVEIPEVCPPSFRCSTMSPTWMNDAHPPRDGHAKSRQFCYNNGIECNTNCFNALVKNCGTFYVYKLKPLSRNSGYCAGPTNVCAPTPEQVFAFSNCTDGKASRVFYCSLPGGASRFVRETKACQPDQPINEEVLQGTCHTDPETSFPVSACSVTCGKGQKSQIYMCTMDDGTERFVQDVLTCDKGPCP